MKIALLLPYKGEPELLNSAISDLVTKLDDTEIKIYISYVGAEEDFYKIDCNRETMITKFRPFDNETGPVTAVNHLYHYAKEWGDLFINWGIDIQIAEPIFRRISESYKKAFPEGGGLLGLNDGYWGERLATHCVWDRKFVEWLNHPGGGIWFDDYIACGCDNENTERAKIGNRFAYDNKLKIIHPTPEERQRKRSIETRFHDRELLDNRRSLWA